MIRINLALKKDCCIEMLEHNCLENFLEYEIEKYLSGTEEKYHVFILSFNYRKELGDILFKFVGHLNSENTIYLGDIEKKLKVEVLPDGSKDIVVDIEPPVFYIPKNTSSEEINLYVLKVMENLQKKDENFLHNYFDKKAREEEKKKLLKKETRYEYDENELMK